MNWEELQQSGATEIAGAVSGGLDSCTVANWLKNKGFKVHCFTVDLGQPDEENLDAVTNRMIDCGAHKADILPGLEKLAEAGLKVLQSQARYEGGYWNTTGIARPVTVEVILDQMKTRNLNVLFHGATGRGNDQVRFQLVSNTLEPSVTVYAPWRDRDFLNQFPGRKEMIDYCQENNLPIRPASESRYSTDANLLGLTHEAGDLEDVTLSPDFVEPGMGSWPWDAPDVNEFISIEWLNGRPISINSEKMDLVSIFKNANLIAGKNGIGIGTHVIENRFVGVKSRGIYESPGMELLGNSFEYLMQFILDRRAREFYDLISKTISNQIYEGYWFDLATTSALHALEPIISLATGTITLKLHKGNVFFDSAEDTESKMPHSLYSDDSSMEAQGSYDHVDAEGFLNILGVSSKNVGRKQFPHLNR